MSFENTYIHGTPTVASLSWGFGPQTWTSEFGEGKEKLPEESTLPTWGPVAGPPVSAEIHLEIFIAANPTSLASQVLPVGTKMLFPENSSSPCFPHTCCYPWPSHLLFIHLLPQLGHGYLQRAPP